MTSSVNLTFERRYSLNRKMQSVIGSCAAVLPRLMRGKRSSDADEAYRSMVALVRVSRPILHEADCLEIESWGVDMQEFIERRCALIAYRSKQRMLSATLTAMEADIRLGAHAMGRRKPSLNELDSRRTR